jgi:putative membrane protein
METTVEKIISPARPQRRARSLLQYLAVTARGFCMGAADVVPGVSGGTMAFILGIYEELIDSIRMAARKPFWEAILRFQWAEAMRLVNLVFLAFLAAGIFGAVILLAPGIEYMLLHQPVLIWSFFFGLVLASVFLVAQRIKRWTLPLFIALAAGAAFAYIIVGLVPVQTPNTWWFLVLSGAISICAMILPGISGSFILVLLGKYQFFVTAVNQRDVLPILWLMVGASIGLITFAQILGWLFRRYREATIAVLTGFMIGSLRKVWPWKEVLEYMIDRHGEMMPIVERNILPPFWAGEGFNPEIWMALAMGLLGLAAVLLLDRLASRTGEPLH